MFFAPFIKPSKKLLGVLFLFFCLSCTNKSKPQSPFKHNFKDGTADHIRNISDFLGQKAVLNSEEVFFAPEDSSAQYPALSSTGGYSKDILDSKNLSQLIQIRTDRRGQKVQVSSAQENIDIDPSISFINRYEILGYKMGNVNSSNEPIKKLIGKTEKFRGFPNTTYYILPVFEGNYLLLYKLGPEDKIPYDELPLAKRVGDLLAVPFLGYPIRYCVPEVIPDVNERKTGQFLPQCEGISLRSAQYIELRETDKKVFKYDKKTDLFPRDFFTLKEDSNNWFYVRTVVRSPKGVLAGHDLFVAANLVEFDPQEESLKVRDASGYNIDEEDKIGVLFIPVEWVDYQIQRDAESLNSSFSEEPKAELLTRYRRYFRIKFNQLVAIEELPGKKTLKNVFINDNYFSFNIEVSLGGAGNYLIKYAFFKKPNNPSYVPKQWFEEDSAQYFPSFAEERRYYDTEEQHSQKNKDQFFRLTRFDSKVGEIKWYFSKQTPKDPPWVREMGRLSIELLNRAFEQAGRDSDYQIKIVLDESEDKEVGDIRYNILNLMLPDGKPTGGLLGYGPNVANPITGEILSSTANVWLTNMLYIYTLRIKNYIRFQVYQPSWFLKPFSPELKAELKEKLYKPFCGEDQSCMDLPFQVTGASAYYHERIRDLCPEVTRFIDKHKGKTYDPEMPNLEDKEVTNSCVKKLAFLPILGLTLHEIQHGLGQRHIFSASADSENFYKDYKEIEEIFGTSVSDTMKKLFDEDLPYVKGVSFHPQPGKYSSVMDYMDLDSPRLFVPGKLDIATLRFIYFDKVDLENGGVLDVPAGADSDPKNPQKSINQRLEEESATAKNYRILCGGEKYQHNPFYRETNPEQPLCRMRDYGANPLEVVVNSILTFNSKAFVKGRRYDSNQPVFSRANRVSTNSAEEALADTNSVEEALADTNSVEEALADTSSDEGDLIDTNSAEEDLALNKLAGILGLSILADTNSAKGELANTSIDEEYSSYLCASNKRHISKRDLRALYSISRDINSLYKKWQTKTEDLLSSIDKKIEDYAFFTPLHVIDYEKIIKEEAQNPDNSDFKSYYDIRTPLFDYLSRLLFMPTKHCIYKEGDGTYHALSLDRIRDEARANWEDYPEGSRETLIDCQSPIVKKVTEGLGDFVTEVGFNESALSYFLRPKKNDRIDETSAFRFWLDVKEAISSFITEPNFGKKYWADFRDYMLNGTLLNPYINEDLEKNSDGTSIEIQKLTYGRDRWRGGRAGLDLIKDAIEDLEKKHDNVQDEFGWELRELKDIDYNLDSPFFKKIKQSATIEATKENEDRSVEEIIEETLKEHPQSLYDSLRHSWIAIPWKEDNRQALLFAKVNEFKTCLERPDCESEDDEDCGCENKAEKQAYVEAVEEYYYNANNATSSTSSTSSRYPPYYYMNKRNR